MVIFNSCRPVRSETEFETGTNGATPTSFLSRVEHDARSGHETIVLVVGDGGAALHVPQAIVSCVAYLAGGQPACGAFRPVAVTGAKEQAGIRSSQIGPVALCFQTEHPTAGLPAITDLPAGDAAGRIVTAFAERGNYDAEVVIDVPALAARSPATVGADVEAAPVVHGGDHRGRRFGVGPRSEVRSSCSIGHCTKAYRTQQKLVHGNSPQFYSLRLG